MSVSCNDEEVQPLSTCNAELTPAGAWYFKASLQPRITPMLCVILTPLSISFPNANKNGISHGFSFLSLKYPV